eukprot:Ihof_evm2s41 gene=Ihof_evmTU2s41
MANPFGDMAVHLDVGRPLDSRPSWPPMMSRPPPLGSAGQSAVRKPGGYDVWSTNAPSNEMSRMVGEGQQEGPIESRPQAGGGEQPSFQPSANERKATDVTALPSTQLFEGPTVMGSQGKQFISQPIKQEADGKEDLRTTMRVTDSEGPSTSDDLSSEKEDNHLAPTSNSHENGTPGMRWEGRRKFTDEQYQRLEQYYRRVQQPDKDYRGVIASDCELSFESVTSWFANRRKKDKRDRGGPADARPKKRSATDTHSLMRQDPKSNDQLMERKAIIVNLIGIGDVAKVWTLLYGPNYGPVIHDMPLDIEGHTAVHWAAALGQLPMLPMLLEQGEHANVRNNDGDTPLHRATMWNYSHEKKVFPQILALLAENLPAVNSRGQTCLHVCCHNLMLGNDDPKSQAAEAYIPILLANPALDINCQDTEGNTALGYAVEFGHLRVTKMLLDHGADSSLRNTQGLSVMDCPQIKINRPLHRLLAEHLGLPLVASPAPPPVTEAPIHQRTHAASVK